MAGPYAVRGSVYIGSITGATGSSGTLLKGLEEGDVEIAIPYETIQTSALDAAMSALPSNLMDVRALVILRLRSHDTDSAARILRWLQSSGRANANNAKPGAPETPTALIVRPANTSEPYFYTPSASLVSARGLSIHYSQSRPMFEGAEVVLECGLLLSAPTEPAWMWDSSSALNTAYAALT